jgi:hypothetical protein
MAIFITGCNNDLDLVSPSDPVPLVYGMISPEDSIHTIRLTFSTPAGEGVTDNGIAALLNAEMFLDLRTPDGTVIERSQLVLNRTVETGSGTRSGYPHYLFSCPGMNPVVSYNEKPGLYALTISFPELSRFVYAETRIPPEPYLMMESGLVPGRPVNLYAEPGYNEVLILLPDTLCGEFSAVIRYSEQRESVWTEKSITYERQYGSAIRTNLDRYDSFVLNEAWFFSQVVNHIFPDETVLRRRFESIELRLTYASAELDHYRKSFEFSSDFVQGGYSNVVSGMGLFISFNSHDYREFTLNKQSMDSLVDGICTRKLGFTRIP